MRLSLLEHVEQLADEVGAPLLEAPCEDCKLDLPHGAAFIDRHAEEFDCIPFVVLTVNPGASKDAYLLALHELGHIATGRAPRGCKKCWKRQLALDAEAAAWEWALEHAKVLLGKHEWALLHFRLSTYAEDKRYKRTPAFNRLYRRAKKMAGGVTFTYDELRKEADARRALAGAGPGGRSASRRRHSRLEWRGLGVDPRRGYADAH